MERSSERCYVNKLLRRRQEHKERNMDIPKEEPTLQSISSRTCRACLESNLTEEIRLARCIKCNLIYCVHFASTIDPSQCTECLAEISLHKEIVTKTYTHESYDEDTDTTTTTEYRRRAKSIRLDGMDWLFAQRKIITQSDDSLELAIEYHRQILNGMLAERERRRTEFMHRYAGVKVDSNPSGQVDVLSASSVEVKKTKTISSTRAVQNANAVMQSMMGQGMDAKKILEMLEKIAGGVKK
jgi:hypothetical protein